MYEYAARRYTNMVEFNQDSHAMRKDRWQVHSFRPAARPSLEIDVLWERMVVKNANEGR